MRNKKIYFNKLIIVLISIFLTLFVIKNSFSQKSNILEVIIEPNEINGNESNSVLNMTVKNISNDTIYIVTSPISCISIGNSTKINIYVRIFYETFSPIRIIFFKNNTDYIEAIGGSHLTYLRFPDILVLFPSSKSIFKIITNEILKNVLNDDIWKAYSEIWYAYKKDIDFTLQNKTEYFKKEFFNSVYYKDTVTIEISPKRLFISEDSSLYVFKDGINYKYEYLSPFDSVITKNFIHLVESN